MFVEIEKQFLDINAPSLPFVVTTYGKKDENDYANRKYGFKHHHILWVTAGRGAVDMDGEQFEITAGEGFFVKRGVPHSYTAVGDTFKTVWLTFIAAPAVLEYYAVPDKFRFTVDSSFDVVASELDRECKSGDILTRSASAYSFFVEWMTALREKTQPIPSQIKQTLENRFSENITLDELSDTVGLDKFSLCREYKKAYGITVIEHQKRIRIDKAKQLLRFSYEKISDIAQYCGYDSTSYFCKVFRDLTGRTPKAYRERHIKK